MELKLKPLNSYMQIQQEQMSSELKTKMMQMFTKHSIDSTGHDEFGESMAYVAKENENLVGAMVLHHFWGALHLKYIILDENYRGQKIGSKLLEKAFEYGKMLGCPFIFVETMSFQALDFYLKNGFVLEYSRPGYSRGISFHYLRKDLGN